MAYKPRSTLRLVALLSAVVAAAALLCLAAEGRTLSTGCGDDGSARCFLVEGSPPGPGKAGTGTRKVPATEAARAIFRAFRAPREAAVEAAAASGSRNQQELRRAPSGPDPLHHHDSPRRPQTP